ncbi:MAG TPA: hypothetical protein DCY13_23035 [Verrucomicrobiales bacterium]|nr:hypothetical protein [Verrucomicrobiales bacterium]
MEGPSQVVLEADEAFRGKLAVVLTWYDLGLNAEARSAEFRFSQANRARVGPYRIRTTAWRLLKKRVLSAWDAWSECENCEGPLVVASLKVVGDLELPDKTRLVQRRRSSDGELTLSAILIPDEARFETREFKPRNLDSLMTEVGALLMESRSIDARHLPQSLLGPEVSALNAVRVERFEGAIIFWMGGKVGYAAVPNGGGCPARNATWITGTEYRNIYRLEKM